jgi:hypothetical protein
MNHTDLLTNQEFLKELEKRLPNFNNDELIFLGEIMIVLNPRGEEVLKHFKENYPETHNLIQETTQKLEKESSIKVTIYRCQRCRELILVGVDEKHENVCSKCLENKKNN